MANLSNQGARRLQLFRPKIKQILASAKVINYKERREDLENTQVFAIRHGQSIQNAHIGELFNKICLESPKIESSHESVHNSLSEKENSLKNENNKLTTLGEWIDVQSDRKLIDSSLSERGRLQSKELQNVVNQFKFHTVFVSPLKRAIETAYWMFKGHKDFDQIKFVIFPLLMEKLHVSADLPNPMALKQIQKLHSQKFKLGILPQDENKQDNPNWYVELLNQDLQSQVQQFKANNPKLQVQDFFIQKINDVYPGAIESTENCFYRTLLARKSLIQYITNNQIEHTHKIALVGHSAFFRIYFAEQYFQENGFERQPSLEESVCLENCEIYPDFNFNKKSD
ncbi:UNKNOWN [Stylonychia lemnae]|uniref:Phosphoglycerate mutase family protein n=1 Tax=Stylonychia lemnae TaxID=5949 RepID=A0A078AHX5_STYLE|nr:UNKNOWN [Stylonychia lemnae]|eukprot:CDW81112.1 UNKNOWN [Stylonychia lemnae]